MVSVSRHDRVKRMFNSDGVKDREYEIEKRLVRI